MMDEQGNVKKEDIAELLDGLHQKMEESLSRQTDREGAMAELRARNEDSRTTDILEEIRDILATIAGDVRQMRDNALG